MSDGARFTVKLESHKAEVLQALALKKEKILEEWGILGEGYAIQYAPVDTSNLKNSISHTVDMEEGAAIIGTNVEYAPYQEYGTGIYAEEGSNAKKIPWSYQDEEGRWHTTSGNRPHPFLRPAFENHLDEYKDIMMEELQSD